MILSEIWVYPIKSLGGVSLASSTVTERGLLHDRTLMLVDASGQMITQREYPQMALFQVVIEANGYSVFQKNTPEDILFIGFEENTTDLIATDVWGDPVATSRVSDSADAWFSEKLGVSCRLVRQSGNRPVDERYAKHPDDVTSLADGYPLLVITDASLQALNERLETPVEMARFRPNLVVSGAKVHSEDTWATFRVGSQTFHGVKPCARCVMITIDPITTQKSPEPTRTLAGYRKANNKIYFGENLLAARPLTRVQVGDSVEVLSLKKAII